ncbi:MULTISPECIES: FadR/GntR family transcriptional regulator [unclassified Variovorax]|uniref:FadR/GntR family transcriptional regulator n=1 Tax=unclassified Variovorax TaxID=663243 RepID=UPI003F46B1EC
MNIPGPGNDVRRQFSDRIVGPDSRPYTLTHHTVAAMAQDLSVRGWPEGHLIGSVSELRQRFGVGRKACQEAIAILQTRRLIHVRRGAGGGLYVCRPGLHDTAEALILHLLLSRTSPRVLHDARLILCQLTIRAIIGRGRTHPSRSASAIPCNLPGSEFRRRLSQASGNAPIAFLTDILEEVQQRCNAANVKVGANQPQVHAGPLEDALLAAIRSGNVERADVLMREHVQTFDGPAANAPTDMANLVPSIAFFNSKRSCARLAGLIVGEILARPSGASIKLGAEWDVGARHGYTSDIVRPALRMLEDLGIVACCRGRAGGVISTPPSIATVVRLVNSGIASCDISPVQNFELASQLMVEGARLAAQRNEGAAPTSTGDVPPGRLDTLMDLIDVENGLLELIDNPILTIFVRSLALQSFSSNGAGHPPSLSAKVGSAVRACSLQVSRAIRHGEATVAVDAAKRKSELMRPEVGGGS